MPVLRARGFRRFVPLGPLLLPLLLSAAPGFAHDLWMIPGRFRLDVGESTRIFINNGDVYPEALSLLAEPRVASLWVYGREEREAVTERRVDGRSLTFDFQGDDREPGIYALALETRPRRVRLKAEDFNDYLEEEGLSEALEVREERGETDQAAVERYSKWAKTYILVAGPTGEESVWAEPVGQRFEIVPLSNPLGLETGEPLSFKLVYEDEPLPGAVVIGGKAGSSDREIRATTGEDGVAVVSFSSSGRWYLRAIHMMRLEENEDAQWESVWCTLTFEVSDPAIEEPDSQESESLRD